MADPIITFRNVWERFIMPEERTSSLKHELISFLRGTRKSRERSWFYALQDVSFTVARGEITGLIGENGSGKSTVLNLIAGIYQPDQGNIDIKGNVSALLELGTGFHPELTGRENISLTGSLLGLTKDNLEEKFQAIEEFAGIGKFIDVPIKTYSSGMYIRLAFALAISVDADILLVDEVLSVGDLAFQQKCIRKIMEFKEQGKTILFVSHDLQTVRHLCQRALLFQNGRLLRDGSTLKSIEYYIQKTGRKEAIKEVVKTGYTLLFNNGRFTLLKDEALLTAETGFYTMMAGSDCELPSYSGYWRIVSTTAERLVFEGSWSLHRIRQRWEFDLEEDSFTLTIVIDQENENRLKHLELHFEALPAYTQWQDVLHEGTFPTSFTDEADRVHIHDHLENSRFVRLKSSESLPDITLEHLNLNLRAQLTLSANSSSYPCHLVSLREQLQHDSSAAGSGQYSTTVKFGVGQLEADISTARRKHADEQSLSRGAATLIFTGKHFHLLYNDRPCTSMLGLYSSHRSGNTWNDTAQGWWTVKRDGDFLRGTCRLKRFPVSLHFAFHFEESGNLIWSITREIHERIQLDRLQMNVMLNEHYLTWTNGEGKTDTFPEYFNAEFGGDWEALSCQSAKRGPITLATDSHQAALLPDVSFEVLESSEDLQANIINSDIFFHSRVLQFLLIPPINRESFEPGTELFATARITLTPTSHDPIAITPQRSTS